MPKLNLGSGECHPLLRKEALVSASENGIRIPLVLRENQKDIRPFGWYLKGNQKEAHHYVWYLGKQRDTIGKVPIYEQPMWTPDICM